MASSPIRTWLHGRLVNDAGLVPVVGGRVYQQGSIISAQVIRPYLVHHFGNNTDEGLSEDAQQPKRQFLQIYIHVDQGDYGPIDDIMDLVQAALGPKTGAPANLIQVRYLETSQDLQDDILQTYFRYMRYQLIQSR